MRILLLEDNAMDIELTQLGCKGLWDDCEIVAVSNREGFIDALARGPWDGIISDSGVPGLSGEEALGLARQSFPNTPFAFLCGAISPDRRQTLAAMGPVAFASKDNPDEVSTVLRRMRKAE